MFPGAGERLLGLTAWILFLPMEPQTHPNVKKGFTAIELIIGIALFMIVSGGLLLLINLYINSGRLLPASSLATQTRRAHQLTLEDIKKEIRQAKSILATTTVDAATFTTGTTTLVLRLYGVDSSNNILGGVSDYVIYSTTTTTPPLELRKRVVVASGSKRSTANLVLNNAVGSLSFTYNTSTLANATKVEIFLETSRTIGNVTEQASSTIEASLR